MSQVVTNGHEVDEPNVTGITPQAKQTDVSFPWIEGVAFLRAVGLYVECDAGRDDQVGGDPAEVISGTCDDGLRYTRDSSFSDEWGF